MRLIQPKTVQEFCRWHPDPNYADFQFLKVEKHSYMIYYRDRCLGGVYGRKDREKRWSVLHHNKDGWYHTFLKVTDAARFLLAEAGLANNTVMVAN